MTPWVLVTRPTEDLGTVRDAFASRKIDVLPYPVLREVPYDDPEGWTRAAQELDRIRLVILTSPRAPRALMRAAAGDDVRRVLLTIPAAVVGSATSAAAREAGFRVTIAGEGGAKELTPLVIALVSAGDTVLHACGREHRDDLATALTENGIRVVPVVVYAMDETPANELPRLPDSAPDAVLLTSPRAARAYVKARPAHVAGAVHYALGSTTAREAQALGLTVTTLRRPSLDAIVEELCPT